MNRPAKSACWVSACLAVLGALAAYGAEKPAKVAILAYINQSSGCQKDTEAFLQQLVAKYPGRVSVEFIDIGGAGAQRWKKDGLHCMGIMVNGSTAAEIVTKGVHVPVRFEMPAGYQWTHEDLGIAVRQALDGVAEADRRPPAVTTRPAGDKTALAIDGNSVLELKDGARLTAAAKILKEASPAAVSQEDFALRQDGEAAEILFRGQALLRVTPEEAKQAGMTVPELATRWGLAIATQYPLLTRPAPGQQQPGRR